jgi:hypothetical protein
MGPGGVAAPTATGAGMLIDTRSQRELIAALHLEPLFESEQFAELTNGEAATSHAVADKPDHAQELLALLQILGIGAEDSAGSSIMRDDDAIAHATANIIQWMKYLPEDCVKTIVKDGWHWSI